MSHSEASFPGLSLSETSLKLFKPEETSPRSEEFFLKHQKTLRYEINSSSPSKMTTTLHNTISLWRQGFSVYLNVFLYKRTDKWGTGSVD